jgi:sugar lactone lactonase YvrE
VKSNGIIGRFAAASGAAAAALLIASAANAQAQVNLNVIPIAVGAQAESIAATADGGLIIGTTGGTVYKLAPGANELTEFVTGLEGFTLGVYVNDGTAYVCNGAALRTYDWATGDAGVVYDFPGGTGFCNDIAFSPDGTLFVTDTGNGRVLALVDTDDGPELQTVVQSTGIAGVDGLAFVDGTLYVNDVRADKMIRIDLDGTTMTGFTVLNTSQPVDGPDGMRVTDNGDGVWQADNATQEVVHVTFDGDNATVTVVGNGFPAATRFTSSALCSATTPIPRR